MLNFVIQYFTAWVDFYSGAGFSHRFFFLPNDTINVLAIVHTHVDTIPDSQPVWQRGGCWHPYSMLECPCGLMHALWTSDYGEGGRERDVWACGRKGRQEEWPHSHTRCYWKAGTLVKGSPSTTKRPNYGLLHIFQKQFTTYQGRRMTHDCGICTDVYIFQNI